MRKLELSFATLSMHSIIEGYKPKNHISQIFCVLWFLARFSKEEAQNGKLGGKGEKRRIFFL